MIKKSKKDDFKDPFVEAARKSNSMNPEEYDTMSSNLGVIYRKIVDLEEETSGMSIKVNKMYSHIMADPETGSDGLVAKVLENTKNIAELHSILDKEIQLAKLLKFPVRIEKIEDEVDVIKNDLRLKEVAENSRKEQEIKIKEEKEKEDKSREKRLKMWFWIIGSLLTALNFVKEWYFKEQ